MPQRYDATPMPGRARGAGRSDREDVTTAVLEVLAGRLRPTGSSFIHAQLLIAAALSPAGQEGEGGENWPAQPAALNPNQTNMI